VGSLVGADRRQANEETRQAWNQNAAFWDERMGEGNDFVEVLIWPPTERLLDLRPGQRVLDIACGNGLTSRRLAAMGAEVVAADFAEGMIAHARNRTLAGESAGRITYHVLDATDEVALLALGERQFDAALCWMPPTRSPCWLWVRGSSMLPCARWPSLTWQRSNL
jgi:2-polyprenyl-3-methyl-5-hydroxy-6-metoxy-1,4-benzoquinol methylase